LVSVYKTYPVKFIHHDDKPHALLHSVKASNATAWENEIALDHSHLRFDQKIKPASLGNFLYSLMRCKTPNFAMLNDQTAVDILNKFYLFLNSKTKEPYFASNALTYADNFPTLATHVSCLNLFNQACGKREIALLTQFKEDRHNPQEVIIAVLMTLFYLLIAALFVKRFAVRAQQNAYRSKFFSHAAKVTIEDITDQEYSAIKPVQMNDDLSESLYQPMRLLKA